MQKQGSAPPREPSAWTRIDRYAGALQNRRAAARRRVRLEHRTEPEAPRLDLSTLPFLALLLVLVVLTVAFVVAAWPGHQLPAAASEHPAAERGTAPKGWFQDAEREMR